MRAQIDLVPASDVGKIGAIVGRHRRGNDMVQRLGFVLTIVASGWAGAALADSEVSRHDAESCQPDIHRLCDKFFPDEKLVATCLVDRRAELSVACAEVLARPQDGAPAEPVAPPSAAKP